MGEISKQKMLSWLITTKSHAVVLFDQENIPYSQEDEATFNEIYRLIESGGEKDAPKVVTREWVDKLIEKIIAGRPWWDIRDTLYKKGIVIEEGKKE